MKRWQNPTNIAHDRSHMPKPKIVCVLGSAILTPLLLGAVGCLMLVVMVIAVAYGWMPEPPPHPPGTINTLVNVLLDIGVLVIAAMTYRRLFRKCFGQGNLRPPAPGAQTE